MIHSWTRPDGSQKIEDTGPLTNKRMERESGWRVPAMVRWPDRIEPGTWSNDIMHHMDRLPTFLAVAGEPDIKQKLLSGYEAGRGYKVHLDGYTTSSRP